MQCVNTHKQSTSAPITATLRFCARAADESEEWIRLLAMKLQPSVVWLVAICILVVAFMTAADEADGDETFQLDNGCTITRKRPNSTAPPVVWFGMPLPHLNCSGAGLTRLNVEGMVEDTKSITLSYNDLIEFHVDDLEPFPKVEKLELKVNKLTRILPSHSNPPLALESLKYLSVTHNQLQEVPNEALRNFPMLKFFVMFSNELRHVRRDDFRYNKNLQFLYLGPNPIESFEDDFLASMNLTGLGLRSCGLTRVPPHIAAMTKLVYLDLSVNKLTRLEPNSFRDCQQLRWLEMASNQIKRVDPLAFQGAYKLKMVDLSDNLVATIPNGTFQDMSKQRVEVDLYENPINCDCSNAWLKGWYDELVAEDLSTELRFKCAKPRRNYGKKAYQVTLGDFTCRDEDRDEKDSTECSNNGQQQKSTTPVATPTPVADPSLCPDECTCYDENGHKYATPTNSAGPGPRTRIQGFAYMKFAKLSVSCTAVGLRQIPVKKIRADVQMLMLSDNNIETLDLRQLGKFKDLSILELKRNGIKTIIPDTKHTLSSLLVLNLRFNEISSVTESHLRLFPNLQVLMLYHNNIHYFPRNLFKNNKKLKRLYLGPNPVTRFQFDFLKKLDVSSLSLRNMSLTEVPPPLATMKSLTYLDLSDNSITNVPKNAFSSNPALYRVVLENNNISNVHVSAFNGSRSLQKIYLSENNIRTLPQGVFANVSDEKLKVELWSNPMVCDCNLKWFKKFIEETEENDPTSDLRFICDTPSCMHNKKSDELTPEDFVCSGCDDADSSSSSSCAVCKVPSGSIALAVLLTFLSTILISCAALRCTFRRKYSELLQYAKERGSYGQVGDM